MAPHKLDISRRSSTAFPKYSTCDPVTADTHACTLACSHSCIRTHAHTRSIHTHTCTCTQPQHILTGHARAHIRSLIHTRTHAITHTLLLSQLRRSHRLSLTHAICPPPPSPLSHFQTSLMGCQPMDLALSMLLVTAFLGRYHRLIVQMHKPSLGS